MSRPLKVKDYDGTNHTITGLERISDSEIDNELIPRILEEFALNAGTGHVTLDDDQGDQIGLYETTWYANDDVGDSLERYDVNYDFDDGSAQGWTFDAANFGLRTDRTQAGSHSIGINDGSAPRQLASIIPDALAGGFQIDRLEFWYQESSSSTGSGVRLYDSAGNPVIGVATDNPGWDIEDANGIESDVHTNVPSWDVSPSYDTWYKVEIQFDWGAGEATIGWFDVNGLLLALLNRPLINVTDIEQISIEAYNGGSWTSGAVYAWYDSFNFSYHDTFSTSSTSTGLYQTQDPVGSLYFDGDDDYAEVASDANAAGLVPDSITIEFWTRRLSGGDLNACEVAVDGSYYLRFDNDGTVDGRIWADSDGDSGNLSAGSFNLDEWYHGALTYDGSYIRIYVNGEEKRETGHLGAISKTTSALLLGGRVTPGDLLINGYLSDVRIWNYARTQSEIQSHMNTRLGGDESGLIGYWPLANSSDDDTSNDNHATITGATWDDAEPEILPSYMLYFDETEGTLKRLNKTDFHDAIVDRTLDQMVNDTTVGSFRIFEGETLPGGVSGSWEKIGEFAHDSVANGTVNGGVNTQFTLWKKISSLADLDTANPIKFSKEKKGLQRISDREIRKLAVLLREKIHTTGIGLYALGENAPSTGTWVAVGDPMPDERYDVAESEHYHSYAGSRDYSGNYGSNYGSNYNQNYGSNYTRNFSANYNANYSSTYSSNLGGKFLEFFTGYFTGNFTGFFTGNYGNNYNSNYGSNYSSAYSGFRKYSTTYAGVTTEQTIQSTKSVIKSFRLWLRVA